MTIKKFTNEFQDYLFNKITVLNSINPGIDSGANVYACFQNALSIIEDYKTSLEFLETEGLSVKSEIESIFNSLNNKIDKINRFAQSTISINNNRDNYEDVRTIVSYELEQYLENWESNQKVLTLPMLSTHIDLSPYSKNIDETSKTASCKFLIKSEIASKYISIQKDIAANIVSISYLNSARELLKTTTVISNLSKTSLIGELPLNTSVVIIEYTYSSDSNITITPLTFRYSDYSVISLESKVYEYSDILSFIINSEIPFGCYAQMSLALKFQDINGVELKSEEVWLSINNDGNIIKKYNEIKNETVLMVWKDNCFVDYKEEFNLTADTYVLCKPKVNDLISLYTEESFYLNVKHAKIVEITPTLHMYSLLNNTVSPRIYSIIGITKNE